MTLRDILKKLDCAEFTLTFGSNTYHATFLDYLNSLDDYEDGNPDTAQYARFSFDNGDSDEFFELDQNVTVFGNCIHASSMNDISAVINVFVPVNLETL